MTKTVQDYLQDIDSAGFSLTDVVKTLNSHLANTRDSVDSSTVNQYLAAARNNMQTALLYLQQYEAVTESRIPVLSRPDKE